nr:ABC transporter permease subunit [Spirochaetaceae bacterium]
FLSISNLIIGTVLSVVIALLLNELIQLKFKKFTQTIIFLPHFLSWVVVASLFSIMLSPTQGFINNILGAFGHDPIYFLAEKKWWTPVFLLIQRWKETGWGTIIYLAALSGVNPALYEAAMIDGANRWQQTLKITLPSLSTTIMVVFVLNLGKVMNIFQSVFTLQNDIVLKISDVLKVYSYRVGILNSDYGMGTTIGVFTSLVGLTLVLTTDRINRKIRGSSLL